MSDVSYSVELKFLQSGSLGNVPGLEKLSSKVRGLKDMFTRVGDSLGSGLSSAATSMVSLATASSVAHSAIELMKVGLITMNAEVEQMSITMSTMFAAHGNSNSFASGMEASQELMTMMRRDAAELPGEFKDLSNIMLRMTTPALNAGLSIRETEHLAANAMAIGVGSGMRADVVGREMGALIQGQMRKQMPILKVLPNFNIDSKAFNNLPIEKRVERLKQALGMLGGREAVAMKDMRAAFMGSWIGQISTMRQNLRDLAGDLTYHLFERIKTTMAGVNEWFASHGAEIHNWARNVGWYLANGFSRALNILSMLEPSLMRMGRFLSKEAKSGRLGGDALKVLGVGAALKTGAAVAPLAGGLAKYGPELLSGAGAATASVGAVLGFEGLAASLAGVGIIAGIVAGAITAVYGAFEGLANWASPLHGAMASLLDEIETHFGNALTSLAHVADTVGPALTRVAEAFGSLALAGIDGIAWAIDELAAGLELLTGAISNMWEGAIKPILQQKFPGMEWFFESDSKLKKLINRPEDEHVARHHEPDLDKKVPVPDAPNHTTHIHNVEIKVNSNQDPSRIAKKTLDILKDFARHPTTSPSGNPNAQFTLGR